MKVLVIGASRGIGLELVHQYLADGCQVTATARSDAALASLLERGAEALALDVLDASSCAALASHLQGRAFDLAIVNAGVYGPEKAAPQAPLQDEFDQVMRTNVLGPMRMLEALPHALAQGARVVVISSRMGSMGLRTNPNGWLYRASKAAVNSALKDASLALAGRATCVAFHPGWVKTDMGGPQADLEVSAAVAHLRSAMARLTPDDNGSFLNFDGTPLAW